MPISSSSRTDVPFTIDRTDLYEADINSWSFSGNNANDIPFLNKESLFTIRRLPSLPRETNDPTLMSVTFEVSEERGIKQRTNIVFFFDLLALIGGLSLTIYALLSLFMSVMNFNRMENWLVSQLYKMRIPDEEHAQVKFLQPYNRPSCCEWFCCAAITSKQRAMAKARTLLRNETNLVDIIRFNRFLTQAMKHVLSPELIAQIEHETNYLIINPNLMDESFSLGGDFSATPGRLQVGNDSTL